jgi:[FeFe] hydrogenase (group B1/B3)
MRYEYKTLAKIRHQVFSEVSKVAFDGDADCLKQIPYTIISGEVGKYRDSVFLERAIVSERVRLAMGLSLRPIDTPQDFNTKLKDALIEEKYYEPPLINIIKFACNKCETNMYEVSHLCRACLAHPCMEVCPKQCISFKDGKAYIDQPNCIQCGLCLKVCPYSAIIHKVRPCAEACGMDAIGSDEFGRADIDYDKCVSCGMCLVNCPFGAIADKSQIYQLIQAMKSKSKVIAIVAPAYEGQFGNKVSFCDFKNAMLKTGFDDVYEVAVGADLCTIEEAEDFLKNVPENLNFMATSCCPSWAVMASMYFPEFEKNISMALTPMVLTARLIKETYKDAKIVFVGPCSAKKLEASREEVRSEVDFVITFEELSGIFEAKNVEVLCEHPLEQNNEASGSGRGFAVGGGVAQAVVGVIKNKHPEMDVKVNSADGLRECRKMLQEAKTGKYDGYLLEGMGCPGGCVAGAGCIINPRVAKGKVKLAVKKSELKTSDESKYIDKLSLINR